MTPINITIGKRIRRRRRMLGLTLQGLAEKIGVRYQQVGKWEVGHNRVSIERLLDLCTALEVPVSYFIGEDDPTRSVALPDPFEGLTKDRRDLVAKLIDIFKESA